MALFTKKGTKKESIKSAAPVRSSIVSSRMHVLARPRITEKATLHADVSAYVFDVSARATKRDIISAVAEIYKVTPSKVRIVNVPTKQIRNMRTGKRGVKRGGKKAYVYLKKGETITIS
jgi:large subunit ribosomal protein L23